MKLRSPNKIRSSANNERLKALIPIFEKVERESLKLVRKQNEDYKMNKIIQEVLSSDGPGKHRISEIQSKNVKKLTRKRRSIDSNTENEPHKKKHKNTIKVESDESDSCSENKQAKGKKWKKCTKSDSEESDLSETERKYNKWREDEFDTYNCVNRQAVISNIEFLKKNLKTKKRELKCTMFKENTEIMWSSSTYIAKYIRMCILRHDWKQLGGLIRLLFYHRRRYHPYIKEMTFFAALMCDADLNIDLVKELDLCFARQELTTNIHPMDIWYVEDANTDL